MSLIPVEKKSSSLLSARLTKELLDENLMQRYGTSLDINMGREYQKYLDKKYHALKTEFDRINKNQDEYITIEELTDFINSYSVETGNIYSENYVKKLFSLIDKDHDEKLTIQEFIEAYIKLEEQLRLKKIKLQKLDDELRVAKEKYGKGMMENRDEKITNEGISLDAILYITLLEAKDLKPRDYSGTSDPYVIFKLGDKKVISSYKSGTLNPVWNEDFSFPVSKKNMALEVEVWGKAFGGDNFEGEIKIPLSELNMQNKVDKEYNLVLNNESFSNGTIRLKLHYVFSKYKYFSDHFNKTELQILRLKDDMNELNRYFSLFHKPFGILLYGEINNILDKKILERSEDISAYVFSNRRSVYLSPKDFDKSLVFKVENVILGTFKRSNIQWSQLALLAMYAIVICSFVCQIERSDFVGLFVGVAIWILFIRDKKMDILEYLKYLLYTILGTVLYDLLWLYLHYSFWTGSKYEKIENTLKMFTYLLSLANLLAKIVLMISLWIQYNKAILLKKNEEKKQLHTVSSGLNNSTIL